MLKSSFIIILFFILKITIQLNLNKNPKSLSLVSLDLNKIRNDILNNHNYHRKKHQVGSLSRFSDLESIAQNYAETLAEKGSLVHSNTRYNNEWMGENLCSQYYSINGTLASELWYSEVKDYDYNNPGFSSSTGHFTQLVWKSTTKIGCGAACNSNSFCAVVCNYYPGGNFGEKDDYAKNVLELKEGMSEIGRAHV